jgi:hypothetical protein
MVLWPYLRPEMAGYDEREERVGRADFRVQNAGIPARARREPDQPSQVRSMIPGAGADSLAIRTAPEVAVMKSRRNGDGRCRREIVGGGFSSGYAFANSGGLKHASLSSVGQEVAQQRG